jgi:hypothetical protein
MSQVHDRSPLGPSHVAASTRVHAHFRSPSRPNPVDRQRTDPARGLAHQTTQWTRLAGVAEHSTWPVSRVRRRHPLRPRAFSMMA